MDAASPCSVANDLRWDLTAQQIEERTRELIEQTKRVYDQVGAQEFEDVSYESTLKALADVEVTYTGKSQAGSERGPQVPREVAPQAGAAQSVEQVQNLGGGIWQVLVTGGVGQRRFCPCSAPLHSLVRSKDPLVV